MDRHANAGRVVELVGRSWPPRAYLLQRSAPRRCAVATDAQSGGCSRSERWDYTADYGVAQADAFIEDARAKIHLERGRQLARYGDNALAIPACVDCHGDNITGGGPILPELAQPAAYTAAQLDAFRTGERKNDGDGIMQAIAKRLSDADVKALGEYYGTMP